MKYYDERQMEEIRNTLEREILRWSEVYAKEMMGCLCYFRGKKFFTFLMTNGIVVTKLSENDRKDLSKAMGGVAFEMSGKTVKTWVKIRLKQPKEVKSVLPFVKKSYEAAGT